jgi:hypothetical protein
VFEVDLSIRRYRDCGKTEVATNNAESVGYECVATFGNSFRVRELKNSKPRVEATLGWN